MSTTINMPGNPNRVNPPLTVTDATPEQQNASFTSAPTAPNTNFQATTLNPISGTTSADSISGTVNSNLHAENHRNEIISENKKSAYPTLIVDLPSKGLLYPEDNPLSLGYVEMKFMTAKEEDILTTESYITKGIVLDKLFQSLIVSKIDYDTLLIADRDAIMIAARIYGYGEIYETTVTTPSGKPTKVSIDLKDIKSKEIDTSNYIKGLNSYTYTTSVGDVIRFKLLTTGDEKQISEASKKVKHGADGRDTKLTTRMLQMIESVNGDSDKMLIKMFIETDLKVKDSRAFRKYVADIQPGVDMSIQLTDEDTGEPFHSSISIGLDFFWPDAGL